ncbi:MAG: LamG-like jellyroll fold domain-containing protein, partial [Planctomycetota bacterium]
MRALRFARIGVWGVFFGVVIVCVFDLPAFGQYEGSLKKAFFMVRKDPNASVSTRDDNLSSEGKLFFNGSGWVFTWTPGYDDAGTYEVTFTSTNGGMEDFETITITVNDVSGLVGHWTMDDNAANTTVADSSGNGNDGTARQYTRDLSTAGRIEGAFNFNGLDDYIDCGSDGSLDITGSVSISAWVKFDSLPDYDYQTIVAKRGAGTDVGANYALRKGGYEHGDELQFCYHDGTAWHAYTTLGANLTWGQWYHVVVTFEFGRGKSIKCYLNNNLLKGGWTTGDGNSSVQTNTKPVTIGGLTAGQRAEGSIDNVMIFDRALTRAEISDLYNEGAGLKVDLAIDNLWMYQNLPGQVDSALTATVSVVDDPMGNSGYSYEWEILLPRDVSLAPTTVAGGGGGDAYWTFAARGSDEPAGLSDLGQTFTVRVTVTGDDYGDAGIAEAEFGVALLGDINNDGAVNVADTSIVNAFWRTGSAGPYTVRDCDLNCDGAVNMADHVIAEAILQGTLGQSSV